MIDGTLSDFDIYMTDGGLVQVSNEVRRRMLKELTIRPMSLTELAKITKKAQSTLSVHLDKMVGDNLVSYVVDTRDSRKKIYSLTSRVVATSKHIDQDAMALSHHILSEAADDPSKMYRLLVRSMVLAADGMGFSFSPMLKMLGENFAKAFSRRIAGKRAEGAIDEIKSLFSQTGVGEVSVYTFNPLTIIIKSDTPMTRPAEEMLGMFYQGVFLTILSEITACRYTMTDQEVFGSENNYYRMVIEPIKSN